MYGKQFYFPFALSFSSAFDSRLGVHVWVCVLHVIVLPFYKVITQKITSAASVNK
jgi:hypothetical protein